VTFWQIFFRVLLKRPRAALEALYWRMTGLKVRAANRLRMASANLQVGYEMWISNVERSPELSQTIPAMIERWPSRPRFSVIVYPTEGCTAEQMRRSVESVERQTYPDWTLADGGGPLSGDYVVPLQAGNALPETALFRYAEAVQSGPPASILYGDHDQLDQRGRRTRPWFKPQWNSEMFLGLDYLSQAVAIETKLANRVGIRTSADVLAGLQSALLQATEGTEVTVVHVPHVLCHVDSMADIADQDRSEILSLHLQDREASCAPGPFGTTKICWPLPSKTQKVSIIVPTKDKVELLQDCVGSVLRETSYPSFEIIIIDNNSIDPRTTAYLHEISAHALVRVLPYVYPYNFSAINNFAAAHADGTYLCFLNNDTEVVEADWLTEMMRYAVRPDVGAVGAKLLYPDGSIQHAGVIVGMGDAAGHAHRYTLDGDPGYFCQAHVAQFVTAVTAACMVVEKEKFQAVGGLDEEDFAIAYNDVDLCLKLQSEGLRNVYVPHAILLHHETQSRGHDLSPQHLERYAKELRALQNRWGTKAFQDPLHNPNLDRYSETYVIKI
jgi:GT2 family glycosyltransferase